MDGVLPPQDPRPVCDGASKGEWAGERSVCRDRVVSGLPPGSTTLPACACLCPRRASVDVGPQYRGREPTCQPWSPLIYTVTGPTQVGQVSPTTAHSPPLSVGRNHFWGPTTVVCRFRCLEIMSFSLLDSTFCCLG